MVEWLVASLLLVALLVLVCRKGHRHLLGRKLPWAITLAAGGAAWMLEALPFTAFRNPPSLVTAVAVGCGLFSGRLVARGIAGWARGTERDLAQGAPPPTGIAARVVHPLVGVGLGVFGVYLLHVLVAARHEQLETLHTPRDPQTQVVLGAEDVRLAGANGHAVLLVHGFTGSPADFGDLPARLHAAGFTVRALRLPGHGIAPVGLDEATPEELAAAVEAARAELAATHARVSLVGFSFGGALVAQSAARAAPHRLVLVNPWFGETVRPWWFPVPLDVGTSLAAATMTRVLRPPTLERVNDPAGRGRVRCYATLRTQGLAAARDHARAAGAAEAAAKLATPTLVLVSSQDRTASAERAREWHGAVGAGEKRLVEYPRSDHVLFLDYEREEAAAEVAAWLGR